MDKTKIAIILSLFASVCYGQTYHSTGATARTYSTITACEATENDDQVTNTEIDVCDLYDDADPSFGEDFGISGGTNNASYYFQISAHAGETIDIDGNGAGSSGIVRIADDYVRLEDFEVTSTEASATGPLVNFATNQSNCTGKNLILHDAGSTDAGNGIACSGVSSGTGNVFTNILIYNVNRGVNGANGNETGVTLQFATVDNCGDYGILRVKCTNVVVTRTASNADFFDTGAGSDYNVSEDATAPGANSVNSVTAANQFVSIGSDYNVQDTAADIYDAGVTIGGVSDDIVGTSRPQGTNPEVGAYEFVEAAAVPAQLIRIQF